MNLKFFVGGLPYAMTDTQLSELFASHGVVKSAQVIMDKLTGRSRALALWRCPQPRRYRQRLQLGMTKYMREGPCS